MTYQECQYHYTLYYYDQASNLVMTIPPEGVDLLDMSAFDADGVYDGVTEPNHRLKSQYAQNSWNETIWQQTPDGGETKFRYDDLARINYSQNAEQKANSTASLSVYAYTIYDDLGRPKQSGEVSSGVQFESAPLDPGSVLGTKKEIVNTYFAVDGGVSGFDQENFKK